MMLWGATPLGQSEAGRGRAYTIDVCGTRRKRGGYFGRLLTSRRECVSLYTSPPNQPGGCRCSAASNDVPSIRARDGTSPMPLNSRQTRGFHGIDTFWDLWQNIENAGHATELELRCRRLSPHDRHRDKGPMHGRIASFDFLGTLPISLAFLATRALPPPVRGDSSRPNGQGGVP